MFKSTNVPRNAFLILGCASVLLAICGLLAFGIEQRCMTLCSCREKERRALYRSREKERRALYERQVRNVKEKLQAEKTSHDHCRLEYSQLQVELEKVLQKNRKP